MPRDLSIRERLLDWGLRVIEIDGWQTRGKEYFNPRGFVWHHTAGARSGNAPSLGICINGRAGIPGPLCHVLQARNNDIYLIAAGRANHAGTGSWEGLSGNSTVFGLEVENVGTSAEPWRDDQLETMCRVAAALMQDRIPVAHGCRHGEWSPSRKIDTHMPPNGRLLRNRTQGLLNAGPGPNPEPEPPQEEEMGYHTPFPFETVREGKLHHAEIFAGSKNNGFPWHSVFITVANESGPGEGDEPAEGSLIVIRGNEVDVTEFSIPPWGRWSHQITSFMDGQAVKATVEWKERSGGGFAKLLAWGGYSRAPKA